MEDGDKSLLHPQQKSPKTNKNFTIINQTLLKMVLMKTKNSIMKI
jgi:hypothetical protein